jgi:hypothetical protein
MEKTKGSAGLGKWSNKVCILQHVHIMNKCGGLICRLEVKAPSIFPRMGARPLERRVQLIV